MSQDKVPSEAIDNAPIVPDTGAKVVGKDPLSDPDLPLKIGFIGKLVGSGEEKKGNINFVVILCCFLILAGCILGAVYSTDEKDIAFLQWIIPAIIGIISGILGYNHGKK